MLIKTKIILIVGASGVGKDTLLKTIKTKTKAHLVSRYITRKPDKSEDNFFVDKDSFLLLKQNGFFVSTWEAHGNHYGIAKNQIISNEVSIISISRGAIEDFEKAFEDVVTINVTLSREALRRRLLSRNRETNEQITDRMNREYKQIKGKNLIEFDNSKNIKRSSEEFLNLIRKIGNEKPL